MDNFRFRFCLRFRLGVNGPLSVSSESVMFDFSHVMSSILDA